MSKIVYVTGPSGMAKTIIEEKLERLAVPLGIRFERVIVNHQGEESDQWGTGTEFPTGEAARALEQFLQIYKP